MSQDTLYNLNTCGSCDHEWYPRGHSVSKRCPHCGSKDVSEITPCKAEWGLFDYIKVGVISIFALPIGFGIVQGIMEYESPAERVEYSQNY